MKVLEGIRPERIEAHLRFLADPLLEGRGAGSRGGLLAEKYIRAVLAGAGLRPAVGKDFRQPVPMLGVTPSPTLSFTRTGADELLPRYGDEYVLEAGAPRESVTIEAELIYVGFGIRAPEYGWDDYSGIDVSGKIVLVRVNDPGTVERPDFFEGHALTYYGRWTYKFEEAARQGAAGAILIHTDESAGYGWNVVRSSNTGEQYQLAESPRFPLQVHGWINEDTARQVLAAGEADYDSLMAAAESSDFRARSVSVRVRASVTSVIREVDTANIVGMLPGSDPERAGEPVILMSHHDHLGVVLGDDGSGTIYPGAYDNASGVALLLTIAQAAAEAEVRLPRPLVFLATTAEESGLLGSEWYAGHSPTPLASTAAVLNVDGVNLQGPTEDIAPLGMERSTLGELVGRAAAAEGLTISPEQHPGQGMFFRQDHFPFARAGVPAIAFDHGLTYRERPPGWGEAWYEEFNSTHYHQPSDAFREDFDYRGAVQQGRVMLRAAMAVASSPELPDWLPAGGFSRP